MSKSSACRSLSLCTCCALAMGCSDAPEEIEATERALAIPGFGEPLAGLPRDQQERFERGQEEFAEDESIEEGLGPVFNDTSCVACHGVPAAGGASTILETRFGLMSDGVFDPLAEEGGSLMQVSGIGRAGGCYYQGERIPADATVMARRLTTPLFGLGLVDAVNEIDFYLLAINELVSSPAEAGMVSVVHDIARDRDAVGRFGWKAQVPTLHQFAGDAYLNEMGVTSPEFPDESCPQGDCSLLACNPNPELNDPEGENVDAFTDFMRLLAPPPPLPATLQTALGHGVFTRLGCNHCHTETLRTGFSDVAALTLVELHPYSDFLLHDMGTLADGIEQGRSTGTLMRTAPLWGLRVRSSLLHDGRAHSPEAAILAHRGQGQRAADAFASLAAGDRANLLAFLSSI